MTTKEREPENPETESGLPDDFDFHITRAYFGFLAEYKDGQAPLLIWDGTSPDIDLERPIIWPIGTGWQIVEEGNKVVHEKDTPEKMRRFNKTSIYGRMLDRVVITLKQNLGSAGWSRDARAWEGMSFHLRREKLDFPGLEALGGRSTVERLMPVAFLARRAAATAAVAPLPLPTAVATPVAAPVAPTAATPLVATLTKMAQAMDRDAFQKAAMRQFGADMDGNLLSTVLDDSENGFHARAQRSALDRPF